MSNLINLILLYGGKSGEHEVSLMSAASVLTHLDSSKYQIIPIGIDKEGCFYRNNYQELKHLNESLPIVTAHSERLPSLWLNGKLAVEADVVFPVVHGPLYEDGCLQGLLELADVAYVGCNVLSSAIGMDKDMARAVVTSNKKIKCARYRVLSGHTPFAERRQFCQETAAYLGWPLFVKPCSLGSSVGIHKVNNMSQLELAIEDALRYDETILVEEFLAGREIEVAVLENENPAAAPLVSLAGEIKVMHTDGFYSYAAKYLESEKTALHVPAKLEQPLLDELQEMAREIFIKIKCNGMARIDFFVDDRNNIYFSEINTLPGFTAISMYPKLWQASGLEYATLLDRLINLALARGKCRKRKVTNYQ